MVVQAGVPVAGRVAGEGDVSPDLLPGGRYATTTPNGSFDGLNGTTVRFLEPGPDTNPLEVPDSDHWATRLTITLAD